MAIQQLNEEQIRTWTLEQKDQWWLDNVYRGNMPQLTWRSALSGFLLGSLLSCTNLYIGAKTGWSLGVGVTSVIMAFAMFKLLSNMGLASEFTVLENNTMQSIATAAGYMTAPLTSSLAAYMYVNNTVIPLWQMMVWNIVLSILGVLFAFPMKRRFINDEQLPFPEGQAAGVVMDTLHHADASVGLLKARTLAVAGGLAMLVKFIQAESINQWLQVKVLRLSAIYKSLFGVTEDHTLQGLITWPLTMLFEKPLFKVGREVFARKLPDVPADSAAATQQSVPVLLGDLTIAPELDLALMGAGGLMGIRAGFSLLVGAVLNYVILAPWLMSIGEIIPKVRNNAITGYGMSQITLWSVWPGVMCMVVATFVSFFAKPQQLLSAFTGLLGKRNTDDVLKDIEFPAWISIVGIPILSLLAAFLAHWFFGVTWWLCLLGLPLTFILSLIAANSTALTSTTPVGATSKITQLFYGIVSPGNISTNIATASVTAEVVSNSSNLLMDIKPGYMLGAKPRQQAIGHVIGIFAGALASVPLFYFLFMRYVDTLGVRGNFDELAKEKFAMPSLQVWRAVAELLTEGLHKLPQTALYALAAAALVGITLEIARIATRGKFPLSPIGLGLAFVVDFNSSLAMFIGSLIFWLLGVGRVSDEEAANNFWVQNYEPICSGIIAGASLIGILDIIVTAFVLPMYAVPTV